MSVSPSAFSRRAAVSYWWKYVHEVLVNRLGGLSLPRESVVRLTDHLDMTLDVYRGRKTTMQHILFFFFFFQILGDIPEFEKAVRNVIKDTKFDADVVVSVFETNIRVLGWVCFRNQTDVVLFISLTLEAPFMTAAENFHKYSFIVFFSKKIRLDVSSESSA